MKVLIVADPLESLDIQTDTTLILARAAKKRRLGIYYCLKEQLSLTNYGAIAIAAELSLTEPMPELGAAKPTPLTEFNLVLMRQDPPFDMGYYSAARILAAADIKVVNEPMAVLTEPEKLLPFRFPQFCPPSLISSDPNELAAFLAAHPDGIILKPLYGFGGRGVVAVKNEVELKTAAAELLADGLPLVAQKLLAEVGKDGDRRCFIVDGEFVGGFARFPAPGEVVANLALGGSAKKCEFTAEEIEICEAVGEYLKRVGILFAGLDLIGERLIEVNITSPTGLHQYAELSGEHLETKIWDKLLKML